VSDLDRRHALARAAAVLGLGGVAGNALGVAFLWDVPSPYRPGDVPAWLAGLHAHPGAAAASAWTFTAGLVFLAAFAALLPAAVRAARPGWLAAGAAVVAGGALLNAAGTLAPLVAIRFLPAGEVGEAVGRALLALTLHLDAAFNLFLGLGLLAVNASLGAASGWPRWQRALGLLAGAASVPVVLQSVSDAGARLLAVSGPLWLAWFTAASLRRLWVGREPPGQG